MHCCAAAPPCAPRLQIVGVAGVCSGACVGTVLLFVLILYVTPTASPARCSFVHRGTLCSCSAAFSCNFGYYYCLGLCAVQALYAACVQYVVAIRFSMLPAFRSVVSSDCMISVLSGSTFTAQGEGRKKATSVQKQEHPHCCTIAWTEECRCEGYVPVLQLNVFVAQVQRLSRVVVDFSYP